MKVLGSGVFGKPAHQYGVADSGHSQFAQDRSFSHDPVRHVSVRYAVQKTYAFVSVGGLERDCVSQSLFRARSL